MKKDNPLYEVKGETLVICLPEELDHHTAGKIRENTDELFLGRKIPGGKILKWQCIYCRGAY